MEPLTWGFIGTLIGTIVGASASIITTYLNNQNSIKIQREQEKFKRNSSLREFHIENCLKVQETFHNAFRLTSLINMEDIKAFKESGKWQKSELNDENDKSLRILLRDLIFYGERIQNNKLRDDLKRIRVKLSSVSNSLNLEESNEKMLDLVTNDFEQFMSDLGTELRLNQ